MPAYKAVLAERWQRGGRGAPFLLQGQSLRERENIMSTPLVRPPDQGPLFCDCFVNT